MASCRKVGTNEHISTYGAAGHGRDYTALGTWEAATDNNLVTAAQSEVLECYADSSSFADGGCFIGDATTNSSYFRIVRPAAGQGHDGTPNTGVRFFVSGDSISWIFGMGTEPYNQVQDIVVQVHSTWLNIQGVNFNHTDATYPNVVGCIALDCRSTNGTGAGFYATWNTGSINFADCLAINCEDNFVITTYASGCYNCTAIDGDRYGFNTWERCVLKNCLAKGNPSGDFYKGNGASPWGTGTGYNSSGDTSAPGSNSRVSQTFTFVNAATDDYKPDSGDTGSKGHGTALNTDPDGHLSFDDDLEKSAWGGTWDIGAIKAIAGNPLSLTVGDQIPGLSDAVTFTNRVKQTLVVGDQIPALTDGLLKLLQVRLTLAAGDQIPGLTDGGLAFAGPFPYQRLTVGDQIPGLSDSVSLSLQQRLSLTVGELIPGLSDGFTKALSLFEGPEYVFLVKIHLDSGIRRLSSVPIIVPGVHWDPRIQSIGTLSRSIEVPAGLVRVADGEVVISDTDRVWRDLLSTEVARNKVIDIHLIPLEGGNTLAGQRIYKGKILTPTFPEGQVVIPFTDCTFEFFEEAIPMLGTLDNFPGLPQGASEIFVPIIFGRVLSTFGLGDQGAISCPQFDQVRQRYVVSRYAVQSVPTVYRKKSGEDVFSPVAAGEYTITTEPQTIGGKDYQLVYVDFHVAQDEGVEIRADVIGTTSRNLADTLQTYLTTVAGHDPAEVNLISMNTLAADFTARGWLCDWAVTQQMTHREAISQLMGSFNADFFQDKDGLVAASLSPANPTPVQTYNDTFHLLRESVNQAHPDPMANQITYSFAQSYAEGVWKQKQVWQDADLISRVGKILPKELVLWAVRDITTAADVVADVGSYLGASSFQISFDLSAPRTVSQTELASIIGVTHYGGLEAPSGYLNKAFKILSLSLEPNQLKLTVQAIRRVAPPARMGGKLTYVSLTDNTIPGPFPYGQSGIYSVWMQSGQGNSYDLKRLKVMYSGSWGATWAELDEANSPRLTNALGSFTTVAKGRYLYSVTQETVTGRVAFHQFDMANKTWLVTNEEVVAAAKLAGVTSNYPRHGYAGGWPHWGVDIALTTTSSQVVLVFADAEDVYDDGSHFWPAAAGWYSWPRAFMSKRVGAGSWTTPQRFAHHGGGLASSTGEEVGGLLAGTGEWVHHFYGCLPGAVFASAPTFRAARYDAATNTVANTGALVNGNLVWYPASHIVGWMDQGLDANGDRQLYVGIKGAAGNGHAFVFKESDLVGGLYDPGGKTMYTDAPFSNLTGTILESSFVTNRAMAHCKLTGLVGHRLFSTTSGSAPQWQSDLVNYGKSDFSSSPGQQTWHGTVLKWGAVYYQVAFSTLTNEALFSFWSAAQLPLAPSYDEAAFRAEFGL